jgi:hypothetical protein
LKKFEQQLILVVLNENFNICTVIIIIGGLENLNGVIQRMYR